MKIVRNLRPNFLLHFVFNVFLIGAINISFPQHIDGEAPYPGDSGTLMMPPESTEELQESMPELQLFPPQDRSQSQALPGDPLGSPDF